MKNVNYKAARILANMIDALIMFVLFIAVCIPPSIIFIKDMMAGNFIVNELVWLILSGVAGILLWVLYLSLTPLIFKNATLGMRIVRLVFVKASGGNLSFSRLFFRQLISVLCFLFSLGFTLFFGPISLICSENGRNFYDIFSSTKVVSFDDSF